MTNQITIQDAVTATNQYTLSDSVTTSTDGTVIEIDLYFTDATVLKESNVIATSEDTTYITITSLYSYGH